MSSIVRKNVTNKIGDVNKPLLKVVLQKESNSATIICPDDFTDEYKKHNYKDFETCIRHFVIDILDKDLEKVNYKHLCKSYGIVAKKRNYDYKSFVTELLSGKNIKYYSEDKILEIVQKNNNIIQNLIDVMDSHLKESMNVKDGKEIIKQIFDVNSNAFRLYSEIIMNNIVNHDERTNIHHIIPFSSHEYINKLLDGSDLSEDLSDASNNLVKLSVEDHKLAHLCLFQSLNFDNIEKMYSQETNAAKKQAIRGLCLSIIHACTLSRRYFENELSKKKEKRNPNIASLVENFKFPSFLNPDNKPDLTMFLGFLTHKMPGTNKIIVDSDNNVLSRKDIVTYISDLYAKQNPGLSEQSYKMFSMTLRQIIQYHEGYLEYPFVDKKYQVMNVNLPNNERIAINRNDVNIFSKRADGYKLFCMETGDFVKNLLGEDLIFENPDAIADFTNNTYIDIRASLGALTVVAPNKYYLIQDDNNKHYFLYKNLPDKNSKYYDSCVTFNKMVEEKNLFNKDLYRYLRTFSDVINKSSFSDQQKKFLYMCKKQQYKEELFEKHRNSSPDDYKDVDSMFPDSTQAYEILNLENFTGDILKNTLINPFSNNCLQLYSKKDIGCFCNDFQKRNKADIQDFTFPNVKVNKENQTIQFLNETKFKGILSTSKMRETRLNQLNPNRRNLLEKYITGKNTTRSSSTLGKSL